MLCSEQKERRDTVSDNTIHMQTSQEKEEQGHFL